MCVIPFSKVIHLNSLHTDWQVGRLQETDDPPCPFSGSHRERFYALLPRLQPSWPAAGVYFGPTHTCTHSTSEWHGYIKRCARIVRKEKKCPNRESDSKKERLLSLGYYFHTHTYINGKLWKMKVAASGEPSVVWDRAFPRSSQFRE